MKIMITRTSLYGEGKPCEGAVLEPYTRIDERTTDDPMKLPLFNNDGWYSKGKNHRVENGHIKRDIEDSAWFIEMDSIEDLIDFVDKHGGIVVERRYDNPSVLGVEIYDSYRE